MFMRFGGIDQHGGDLAIDPTSATDLANVDLHPVGEIHTRAGMVAVDAAPGGTGRILGLGMLELSSERYLYSAQPNGLRRVPGSSAWVWSVARAWTDAESVSFAHARYGATEAAGVDEHPTARGTCIYAASGVERPWVDWGSGGELMQGLKYGTGGTQKAGVPVSTSGGPEWRDWDAHPPAGLCLIGRGTVEQLMAWGFPDDPNRIDYSALLHPWHFGLADLSGTTDQPEVDGGWFYALPDESDVIVAVVQVLARIVVLKRRTTIVYSGFPGVDLAVENIYPVGCTSARSVVRVGSELLWWSDQGPVSLFGVQEFGNLQYAVNSDPVRREVQRVTTSSAGDVFAVHDRVRMRVIWFLGPLEGKALVYYYDSPRRWSIYTGALAQLTAGLEAFEQAGGDITIYGGSNDGAVYSLLTGGDDDGEAISSYYVTAWQSLNEHDHRKRMLYVDLLYGNDGAIGATVDVSWDYADSYVYEGWQSRLLGTPASGWNYACWWSPEDAEYWELNGAPPAGFERPAYWEATTQMIIRYSTTGTGFIYRLRFTGGTERVLHLAGWRAFTELKGTR